MREIDNKREIMHKMKNKYYPKGTYYVDWMGFPITEENCPSYHHIIKAEDLIKYGKDHRATEENGAYLGKKSHEYLHRIELIDNDLYQCWNYLFLLINKMGIYPINDVWEMVYYLKEITLRELNILNSSKSLVK